MISGYFGPLTETAVKKFQCKYNIVCSGAPEATGYGVVGPQTRNKIKEMCGGSAANVDIEVESVTSTYKSLDNNQTGPIQVKLKNNGTVAVASFKINLVAGANYANGEGIPDSNISYNIPLITADVGGIGAKQTITKEVLVLFKGMPIHASYKIRVVADSDSQITETNESNNTGYSSGSIYFSR